MSAEKRLAILRALDRNNTARRTREGWFRWERQGVGLPPLPSNVVSPMLGSNWVADDNGKLVLTATGRAVLKVRGGSRDD